MTNIDARLLRVAEVLCDITREAARDRENARHLGRLLAKVIQSYKADAVNLGLALAADGYDASRMTTVAEMYDRALNTIGQI